MATRTGTVAPSRSSAAPGAADAASAAPGTALWPRHILVASDGTPGAAPALAFAHRLAARVEAGVELLSVFTPRIPMPTRGEPAGGQCERGDRVQVAQLLRAVRAQRDAVVRSGPVWPLRFESGDPVRVLTRVAHEKLVDLVVLGIGRADPKQRQHGDVTPARAANEIEVPLYAAAPGSDELPRRVIVALPDRRVHVPTIRAALACTASGGEIVLALSARAAHGSASPLRDPADGALLRALAARATADRVALRTVELHGELLAGILALSEDLDAQLIAVPVCGAPGVVRGLLPNYAGPLLLTTRCSVLVVPDLDVGGVPPC